MNAARESTAPRVPGRRWRIAVMLGAGVLINYFDRLNLSVAAPQLQAAFHLPPERMGLILSAFFWTYALFQIPAGLLLDRVGPTRVGRWGALLWGVASAIGALAGGLGGLLAARLLLGLSEAPSFMVCSTATGYWFPRHERGLATALFDSAAKLSNVIGVPLVAVVVVHAGWRWGFGATAGLSFCYFIVYCLMYRDPSQDRRLSDIERDYIVAGGAIREGKARSSALRMFRYLLRQRKVWGLTIGFAAFGYSYYLFLTWLPSYLVQAMHMSILRSAGFSAIPWIVATASSLGVSGWLIDTLVARGHDDSRVRMSVVVGGMCLGLSVFGAMLTLDPRWAIFWISIALGGLSATATACWSLPSLVAPAGGVGSVGSLMNLANNLMGAAAPYVTGLIVGATGSFSRAFLVAGVVLLVGIGAFAFVLRRIEPIPEPAAIG